MNPNNYAAKETAGLILGIFSLIYGVLALFTGITIVLPILFGLLGLGFGIAAIVIHSKLRNSGYPVAQELLVGRNLGIAGVVTSGVVLLFCVFILIVAIVVIVLLSQDAQFVYEFHDLQDGFNEGIREGILEGIEEGINSGMYQWVA